MLKDMKDSKKMIGSGAFCARCEKEIPGNFVGKQPTGTEEANKARYCDSCQERLDEMSDVSIADYLSDEELEEMDWAEEDC